MLFSLVLSLFVKITEKIISVVYNLPPEHFSNLFKILPSELPPRPFELVPEYAYVLKQAFLP